MKYAEKGRKFSQVSGILMMLAGAGFHMHCHCCCWNLFASGYLEYDKKRFHAKKALPDCFLCCCWFRLCADT